jgi:hypothetical protein
LNPGVARRIGTVSFLPEHFFVKANRLATVAVGPPSKFG